MNWGARKKIDGAYKILRMFISVLLCVSLFATGLMAAPDCGARCCCSVTSQTQAQHGMSMKIQSQLGCCGGSAPMPCDIESAQPHELPDALSASSSRLNIPILGSLSAQISVEPAASVSSITNFSETINHHFRSPPIYLANLAILA